ncbi:uncharacterized protein METZ01_LOCUS448250 [marine metagenome]|uniref:Uncharacterized protein n=1 Tax=marine metagenome TaxID=408172 RepID=A0A382ZIL7_9ZZZZ
MLDSDSVTPDFLQNLSNNLTGLVSGIVEDLDIEAALRVVLGCH